MQVDGTTYGIIPDTFNTILNNYYLNPLLNTFPNATSINSPTYAIAYVTATQDQLLQSALTSLWNAINANTAQGLGLDILAETVLNLERPELVPSSSNLSVTIGEVYSICQVQVSISAIGTSPPYTVPIGWTATGVSTTAPYVTQGTVSIPSTGIYYFNVFSTDTSTTVPANSFTGGSSISGVTGTVTNPASAILGSLTIPTSWQVTASSLGVNSPIYSPQAEQTFTTAGTYVFNVYSDNIATPINATQLNTFSSSYNSATNVGIVSVSNTYPAILGKPTLTDAQFNALRRYYLNVSGQTYYGLEKAILDLNVPSLESVFIAETISDSSNYSYLTLQLSVSASSSSVVVPNGWTALVSGVSPPIPAYTTLEEYTFPSSSSPQTYYVPTYSTNSSTPVAIGEVTDASPAVSGVYAVTNLDPAILGSTLVPDGLGQRGYTVYLAYPSINPQSFCPIDIHVTSCMSPSVTIPIGWQALGFSTISPYETITPLIISSTGYYTFNVYSNDLTTNVPYSSFDSGSVVSGLTYSCYNPSAGTLGGGFDINDPQLQQIAFTCYQYHPLGTQFYPAAVGSTLFTVATPYAGYTYPVYLNPFQTEQVSCNLEIVYNSDPAAAGYANGVFNIALLPTLQTTVLELINQYFLSKTLPTDLYYTINELSEILQQSFTGIVALVGSGGSQFSFGTLSGPVTGLLFLQRPIGYNFNLLNSNFTFSAVDKDTL